MQQFADLALLYRPVAVASQVQQGLQQPRRIRQHHGDSLGHVPMHHTIALLPIRFDDDAEIVENGLKRHFFQMFVCARIEFQPGDPLQAFDQGRESPKVFILRQAEFFFDICAEQ